MRESSKGNWASSNSVEHINCGSLQRIADATEVMAKRHLELIAEVERLKRDVEWRRREMQLMGRRIAGLRGRVTAMKRKAVK